LKLAEERKTFLTVTGSFYIWGHTKALKLRLKEKRGMITAGQWILFSLVFLILFFFIWYTARFVCTAIFAIVSLLAVVYLLNQMALLPEPLHSYADSLFRKETCEQVKAKIQDWVAPQSGSVKPVQKES
jgi:hypothetical protein